MIPCNFPHANTTFGPPEGLDETQVQRIPAFCGQLEGGNLDGSIIVVVAWKPSPQELERLNAGGLIYLSAVGGLPAHFLTTSFEEATYQA